MEGLVVLLALLLGTALAIGVSVAGLQLLISLVPGPARDEVDVVPTPARTVRPPRHTVTG